MPRRSGGGGEGMRQADEEKSRGSHWDGARGWATGGTRPQRRAGGDDATRRCVVARREGDTARDRDSAHPW